jgi:hypothetical protein
LQAFWITSCAKTISQNEMTVHFVLRPVEIQDSIFGLFVIQALDGTICAD